MPNSVICLTQNTYILSVVWSGVTPRVDTRKTSVSQKLDYFLNHGSHSRLDGQHHWVGRGGELYDHLVSTRIISVITNKMFI